ncbi:MAG: tetratricopeptide repeat protein, partial [Myxococcota bacterium]
PHHPAWVPVAVTAQLAKDDAAEALRLADAALEAHPGDVRLLSAKADAHFASEQWDAALVVLRQATEVAPDDVVLQGRRGEAARRAGELEEAREALDAALALDAAHGPALVARLALDVTENRLADAETIVGRLKELRESGEAYQRWLGRYHVARGSGYAGVRDLNRSLRMFRRDPEPRLLLADLFMQAELYGRANTLYRAAARMRRATREQRVAGFLGAALSYGRDRKTNRVAPLLEEAIAAARGDDGDPEAPSPLADDPRYVLAEAQVEYNLGRAPAAQRLAERARSLDPEGPTAPIASLLLALIDDRRRRDPEAHLRAAMQTPNPQPLAFGLLAKRLGASEEGCALGAAYLRAAPRGDARQAIRSLRTDCE